MNKKLFEDWVSAICGVFSGGVTITVTPTAFETSVKITLFVMGSIAGGYLGMLGKHLFQWTMKKLFKSYKNESND